MVYRRGRKDRFEALTEVTLSDTYVLYRVGQIGSCEKERYVVDADVARVCGAADQLRPYAGGGARGGARAVALDGARHARRLSARRGRVT